MVNIPYHFNSNDAPVLYHYTSIHGARGIAGNNSFWLSEFAAMNDPSEFSYARDQLHAVMASGEVQLGIVARLAIAIAIEDLGKATGQLIGSLSTRCDDLTQWRLYGANGDGCVVGIDAAFLEHDAGVAIRSVQYEPTLVRRLLLTGMSVVQDSSTEEPYNFPQLTDFARNLAVELFTIKHPGYADEREVRIMRMLVQSPDGLVDLGGNQTKGTTVPPLPVLVRETPTGPARYIALPLARNDGSSAVVRVGFGPRVSDRDLEENAPFFESRGIQVWRSQVPYR
jgi:hypothetical protein